MLTAGWLGRNTLTREFLLLRENPDVQLSPAPDRTPACILTAEQIEGPFFLRAPVRSDIREDRQGLPLNLRLQIVQADSCTPLSDAVVEIWHCDAAGNYSAYPEHLSRSPFDTLAYLGQTTGHAQPVNEKRYLRGALHTDADGIVEFNTILPGWYEPRMPHIHVKVFRAEKAYLTTQLYFPAALTEQVYATHPAYRPHGLSPYNASNDVVVGENPLLPGLLLDPAVVDERARAEAVLGLA